MKFVVIISFLFLFGRDVRAHDSPPQPRAGASESPLLEQKRVLFSSLRSKDKQESESAAVQILFGSTNCKFKITNEDEIELLEFILTSDSKRLHLELAETVLFEGRYLETHPEVKPKFEECAAGLGFDAETEFARSMLRMLLSPTDSHPDHERAAKVWFLNALEFPMLEEEWTRRVRDSVKARIPRQLPSESEVDKYAKTYFRDKSEINGTELAKRFYNSPRRPGDIIRDYRNNAFASAVFLGLDTKPRPFLHVFWSRNPDLFDRIADAVDKQLVDAGSLETIPASVWPAKLKGRVLRALEKNSSATTRQEIIKFLIGAEEDRQNNYLLPTFRRGFVYRAYGNDPPFLKALLAAKNDSNKEVAKLAKDLEVLIENRVGKLRYPKP